MANILAVHVHLPLFPADWCFFNWLKMHKRGRVEEGMVCCCLSPTGHPIFSSQVRFIHLFGLANIWIPAKIKPADLLLLAGWKKKEI
jgi:hypothetical protein